MRAGVLCGLHYGRPRTLHPVNNYVTDGDSSYDGDDNTSSAPAAAAISQHVPPQPTTATHEPAGKNEAPAFGEEPDTPYTGLPFESNTGNQRSHGGNDQNGSQMSSHEQKYNVDDVNMDNEPFGSGIKEDG